MRRRRPDARPIDEGTPNEAGSSDWTRRDFLRASGALGTTLTAAGPAAASMTALDPPETAGIRRRVVLGRTGIEVPDISFGTFSLESDERLIHHALDRGITHFDTAESYTNGRAEHVLGRALRGRRDRVTLTSKFVAETSHSAAQQMRVLEESLRRLETDYIDIYMNHAVNDVARVASEEWQSFVTRAREQGKIRAVGMSGHAQRLTECMDYVLDEKLVDVFLVAYNFAQQPSFKDEAKRYLSEWLPSLDIVTSQNRLPEVLQRAHREGVGVMVMKTLKGARLNDMRDFERPGRTFSQAAFRWVLSEPSVHGLVVSMTSREMIDEYVEASGAESPDREDLALLSRYLHRNAGSSCLVGCGDCLSSCPAGVAIADVMRTRMYALDYQQPAIAADEYGRLERNGASCLSCSGAPCATACPSGLDIASLTRDTHTRLKRV